MTNTRPHLTLSVTVCGRSRCNAWRPVEEKKESGGGGGDRRISAPEICGGCATARAAGVLPTPARLFSWHPQWTGACMCTHVPVLCVCVPTLPLRSVDIIGTKPLPSAHLPFVSRLMRSIRQIIVTCCVVVPSALHASIFCFRRWVLKQNLNWKWRPRLFWYGLAAVFVV